MKILPKKPTRVLEKTLIHLYEKIHLNWADKSRKDVGDVDPAMDKDFKIKQKEVIVKTEKRKDCTFYILKFILYFGFVFSINVSINF